MCWPLPHSQVFTTSSFDHLQYPNMDGEDLGDLVTCVTAGRQMVDTLGVLADEGSLNPSCNLYPRAGDQSIPKAASVTSRYVSTLCLPDVMHVTKSFRPPLPYLPWQAIQLVKPGNKARLAWWFSCKP